jgi:DNA damage-binding protein 1
MSAVAMDLTKDTNIPATNNTNNSSSSSPPPRHFYTVTANKPTIVSHTLLANFIAPNQQNLIIFRISRLEVYSINNEGIKLELDLPIYGRVGSVGLIQSAKQGGIDRIFFCTERYKYCIIEYDTANNSIRTVATGDMKHRIGRPSESGQIVIIDPKQSLLALHQYDGLLQVALFSPTTGALASEFLDLRIDELHCISMCFVQGNNKPTLAVLYQDPKEKRHIKSYAVEMRDRELRAGPISANNVDSFACHIIPLQNSAVGGLLCIGEDTVTYYGADKSQTKSAKMKPSQIQSWAFIGQDRVLLADLSGDLYVVIIKIVQNLLTALHIELLGTTNAANCLNYLGNSLVFVGSVFGDSQLIRLHTEPVDSAGTFIEIVENYPNLGAIIDMTSVDLDNSGQVQLITASGAFKDGSLRVIRNGIGIAEEASIELPSIKGIWNLKANSSEKFDKYLVESFVGETRILAIDEEELGEIEISGFIQSAQTLYTSNLAENLIVQVTSQEVRLIHCDSLELVNSWPAEGAAITVAHSNQRDLILVALSGAKLVQLRVSNRNLSVAASAQLNHEVSCLFVAPQELVAVGMWGDISVRILSTANSLTEITRAELGGEIIPRSVILTQFDPNSAPYLLCGMGDGALFNFEYNSASQQLLNRKKFSLGTQPISLNFFSSQGRGHIFASCDRPTVISCENHKLLYSNVNLKGINYMAPFNSATFNDCLAFASEELLVIGRCDEIQKLHIKTIKLDAQPRKLTAQPATHSIGVLLSKVEAVESKVSSNSSSALNNSPPLSREINIFHIYDDLSFDLLASFQLDPLECPASILSTQLNSVDNSGEFYYIVGTAIVRPEESEPVAGRILIFKFISENNAMNLGNNSGGGSAERAGSERKLQLICGHRVKGAVYTLSDLQGKILAGVNNKLILFKPVSSAAGIKLTLECCHLGYTAIISTRTQGNYIIVGDFMHSVSLLKYAENSEKINPLSNSLGIGSIELIAKDIDSAWITAVEYMNEQVYLASDNNFNLFSLRKNLEASTDEDRAKLDIAGRFHSGEHVNLFIPGSLVMNLPDISADNKENEISERIVATHIFGTVNGSIGVIAPLNKPQYNLLYKLETALEATIPSVGSLSHRQFRSFYSERRADEASAGFIDGDLIELYLELSPTVQAEVAAKLNINHAELTKRVEELSRIH